MADFFGGVNNPGLDFGQLTSAEVIVVQQIAGLGDPNADRILFWDDSAGSYAWLTVGSGLTITDTTITASAGSLDGSGTTNEIAYWVDSDTLGALAVATYPSLTELAYVKGVTSAIQTQFTGKASTALSNLASVAINTTLVSDTDNTDALGTAAVGWSDLFLGSGAVITFSTAPSTADVTITHSANTLTLAGGTLATEAISTSGLITSSLAGNALRVLNTTDNASVQVARFEGDRATMADDDAAYISLMLSNDGGTQTEFARLTWVATDVNAGTSEDGALDFGVMTAGTLVNHIRLNNTTFRPVTNDSHALGSATLSWSDLFLASGAVVNFNNGNATLTHSADLITSNVAIVVPDEAYDEAGWNGDLSVPTKNAVRDKIESLTGVSTTWTDIGDATADTTIALAGHETLFTSTLDEVGGIVIEISNTDADLANDTVLLRLSYVDDGDANGLFLQAVDDSAGTPNTVFQVGADGALVNKSTFSAGGNIFPTTDDGAALGDTTHNFSDLFLATGAVINYANGNVAVTHSSGILTVSTGDLRVTTAGTNTASVVTVGGTQTLTSKTLTSPTLTTPSAFTTGGSITLAENHGIVLDAALSADGTTTGIIRTGTAGDTLAFGDLVYFEVSNSRWELADADAAATAGDVLLAICVQASSDGNSTTLLFFGVVRADAVFPAMTVGAPLYVGTTAGDIQTAQPSGTDDVIRRVGFAITADELFFCPSADYITHT